VDSDGVETPTAGCALFWRGVGAADGAVLEPPMARCWSRRRRGVGAADGAVLERPPMVDRMEPTVVYVIEVLEHQRENRVAGIFHERLAAVSAAELLAGAYTGVRRRKNRDEWRGPVESEDSQGNCVSITISQMEVGRVVRRPPDAVHLQPFGPR
jgi:hypothetical protein